MHKERIKAVYRNGYIKIKGNMSEKHIDDIIRELTALKKGNGKKPQAQKLSVFCKIRRFLRRLKKALEYRIDMACGVIVGSEKAADIPLIESNASTCIEIQPPFLSDKKGA